MLTSCGRRLSKSLCDLEELLSINDRTPAHPSGCLGFRAIRRGGQSALPRPERGSVISERSEVRPSGRRALLRAPAEPVWHSQTGVSAELNERRLQIAEQFGEPLTAYLLYNGSAT